MSSEIPWKQYGVDLEGLTAQQQMFLLNVIASKSFNWVQAARDSGYAAPAKSAGQLLKNKKIRRALGAIIARRAKNRLMTAEDVMNQIEHWAFFDPSDLCDADGKINVEDLNAIPEMTRKCINSIKVKRFYPTGEDEEPYDEIEIRFVPRQDAGKLVMMHRGLAAPVKVEHSVAQFDFDGLVRPLPPKDQCPVDAVIANPRGLPEPEPDESHDEDIQGTLNELIEGECDDE